MNKIKAFQSIIGRTATVLQTYFLVFLVIYKWEGGQVRDWTSRNTAMGSYFDDES
jgi:hypothetical protein